MRSRTQASGSPARPAPGRRARPRRSARGAVDVQADVALLGEHRLTGVHAHPHADGRRAPPAPPRPQPARRRRAANATKNASPCVSTSTPPCRPNASRTTRRCSPSASAYRSHRARASSRVDPSMSVKRNVTVPRGRARAPPAQSAGASAYSTASSGLELAGLRRRPPVGGPRPGRRAARSGAARRRIILVPRSSSSASSTVPQSRAGPLRLALRRRDRSQARQTGLDQPAKLELCGPIFECLGVELVARSSCARSRARSPRPCVAKRREHPSPAARDRATLSSQARTRRVRSRRGRAASRRGGGGRRRRSTGSPVDRASSSDLLWSSTATAGSEAAGEVDERDGLPLGRRLRSRKSAMLSCQQSGAPARARRGRTQFPPARRAARLPGGSTGTPCAIGGERTLEPCGPPRRCVPQRPEAAQREAQAEGGSVSPRSSAQASAARRLSWSVVHAVEPQPLVRAVWSSGSASRASARKYSA